MFDIEAYLEEHGARLSGSDRPQMVMDCPWCRGHNTLYVNLEYAEEGEITRPVGAWICYKCTPSRKGRTFVPLLAELEGVSWAEARRMTLSDNLFTASPVLPSVPRQPQKRQTISPPLTLGRDPISLLRTLIPEFTPVYDGVQWRLPRYLSDRRVGREVAAAYGLGFCTQGRLSGRIVLPVIGPTMVDYTARAIDPDARLRYISGSFAGQMLFGWHLVRDLRPEILMVVEGPFDALAFARVRIPVVALLGKSISRSKLELLRGLRPGRIVVCLDAGERETAARQAIEGGLDAWVVEDLEGAKDPGEASDEVLRRAPQRAIPADQSLLQGVKAKLLSVLRHS